MGSVCPGNNKPEGKNNNNNKISVLPEGIQEIIRENPNVATKLFNASHAHARMNPNRAVKLKKEKKDKIILKKILDLSVEFSKRVGDNYKLAHPYINQSHQGWVGDADDFKDRVAELISQLSKEEYNHPKYGSQEKGLRVLLTHVFNRLDLEIYPTSINWNDPLINDGLKPKPYKKKMEILLQQLIDNNNIDYWLVWGDWDDLVNEPLEIFKQINLAELYPYVNYAARNDRGGSKSKRKIRAGSKSKRKRNRT